MKINLKKAWDWIVKSSADAGKMSLMVKGILTAAIPTVVLLANFTNIQLESAELENIVALIAGLVFYIGSAVSTIMTIWGFIRKVFTTVMGTNAVIAGYAAKGE